MDKINDGVHHCDNCELYPCSFQEEVSRKDICTDCPVMCCHGVLVALVPCEEGKFEKGDIGSLKMENGHHGWCHYFDKIKEECTIYAIRPIACRVASCRFIREGKIPDMFKEMKREIKEKRDETNGKNIVEVLR